MHRRIGDDREVEQPRLRVTRRDEERVGNPIPTAVLTVVKVDVDLRIEVGVEPELLVGRVEPGEAAVAEDGLRPDDRRPKLSNVPLSCVPPWTSAGFAGFTDRLWNCKVSGRCSGSRTCPEPRTGVACSAQG